MFPTNQGGLSLIRMKKKVIFDRNMHNKAKLSDAETKVKFGFTVQHHHTFLAIYKAVATVFVVVVFFLFLFY